VSEDWKPWRFYVVTLYERPPGPEEPWFEECRRRNKPPSPDGTYGCNGKVIGYTVVSVKESYTGPHVTGQSWVFPTMEAAIAEARARRRFHLNLARERAESRKKWHESRTKRQTKKTRHKNKKPRTVQK
jgi:hypothetical protein